MSLPEPIAEAAARLLARQGPDGFSMEDLAREAGVSRATLYRQAGGREAVLAALAARGVEVGPRVEVRERILAACRTVFTRAGFEAATLEDIAREAGVGPATLYRQFGDKAGLIRAFSGQFGPRRGLQEVAPQLTGDLRADLERVATAVLRSALADLDLLKLALLERLHGGPWGEHLKGSPQRTLTALTRLLEAAVARGALGPEDPQRMARAFAGMLVFSFVGPLSDGEPPPDPEETARFVTRVFLEGLAPPDRRTP